MSGSISIFIMLNYLKFIIPFNYTHNTIKKNFYPTL